ncbi:44765_t:CDS:1, partial [Gigaspora margarita]
VDVSNFENRYLLQLYAMQQNENKIFVDIMIQDMYFNIKLRDR